MIEIDWPSELRPEEAHLYAKNTLDTDLPPEKLWPTLVRAAGWSAFYANCRRLAFVNHEGPDLRLGSVFTFWTFGVPVRTVVTELVPYRKLAWHGEGLGAQGYHAWILDPLTTGGTRFVTEETQRGAVPWLASALLRRGLLYWHQRWLEGIVHASAS